MLRTSWGSNTTRLVINENGQFVKVMRVSYVTKFKQIKKLVAQGYKVVSMDRVETILNK